MKLEGEYSETNIGDALTELEVEAVEAEDVVEADTGEVDGGIAVDNVVGVDEGAEEGINCTLVWKGTEGHKE